jgi:membrane protein implicated in regulation of membrane protease activity
MLRLAALPLIVFAVPALAHPGHVAEAAGHSHFLALAAFAGAAGVAALGIVRRLARRRRAQAG